MILVVKQKNISFLHAWHHCLVIPYTWFWATSNQPWVLGGVVLNTFVHTFMYYYYAVRCVRQRMQARTHTGGPPLSEPWLTYIYCTD